MRGRGFSIRLFATLAIIAGAGCYSSIAEDVRTDPSGADDASLQDATSDYKVRLDLNVWVSAPFDNDEVTTVRFGEPDGEPLCGDSFNQILPFSGLFLARHCDQLITFLPVIQADAPELLLRFVAEHEAFHNLVQFRVGKFRIDSLDGQSQEELLSGHAPLNSMLRAWLSDPAGLGCESYVAGVKALPSTSMKLARGLLHIEAPAEYYAARKLGVAIASARHRQIRSGVRESLATSVSMQTGVAQDDRALIASDNLYEVGALILQDVERRHSPAYWQERYMSGMHVIDIFLASRGCEAAIGSEMMVKYSGPPGLFEAGLFEPASKN